MRTDGSARWITLAALCIAAVLGLLWMQKDIRNVAQAVPATPAVSLSGPVAGAPATFADIAEKLEPAVVNIFTTSTVRVYAPDVPDDFFRRFFPAPPERKQNSLGSGFIIDPDGFILTNYHVVENADQIKVQLSDERIFTAYVVGNDPKTDIALIKIKTDKAERFPYAVLGDSDTLRVGDWVVAVGNPFGLSNTVTAGIVSAKGRFIGNTEYDDLIQTDASINPGNSGGPLVNTAGEVVGINSSIFTRTGGYMGIGFAIPINLAKQVLTPLKQTGKVERSWLGVTIQRVSPELARSYGLDSPKGALVAQIMPGSPAEKAGLKEEDLIIAINGRELPDQNALMRTVSLMPAGSKVVLTVLRNGKRLDLTVELAARPEDSQLASSPGVVMGAFFDQRLGIGVSSISPEDASRLGIQSGVVISEVDPDGAAAMQGLQKGDVILRINGNDVPNVATFKNIAASLRSGSIVRMQIRRENVKIVVAFRLP